jgi:hypothetical protein
MAGAASWAIKTVAKRAVLTERRKEDVRRRAIRVFLDPFIGDFPQKRRETTASARRIPLKHLIALPTNSKLNAGQGSF